MNILYLSDTRFVRTPYKDGSTRYRCYHFAEELLRKQHIADVAVMSEIEPEVIERYDVVVVLRPLLNRRLEKIVDLCRDNDIVLIADFDDLIFDPEHAEASPIVVNRQATEEQISNLFQKHNAALQMFDRVTVSTKELAWHVQRLNPDAYVFHLPNGLSSFWLEYNKHVKKPAGKLVDISYMPGTRSHDQDFAEIQDVLATTISQSDDLRLQIIGALDVDEKLFSDERLVRGPWVDFYNLPLFISTSWINIAPLGNTIFNQSKSHVKFIESAAFGTPVICSPSPDIEQHKVDGLSIATNSEQWAAEIERYKDAEYYRHCSEALQTYARTHCTASQLIDGFISFIDQPTNSYTNENTTTVSKAG